MLNTRPSSFEDHVRVRSTPETELREVAGLVGQVFGETTPSITGVDVIGKLIEDYAVSVHFDGRNETLWFAAELLEFVDRGAGTEIRLDGIPKKWTRNEGGEWVESRTKAWWQFWK